VAVHDRPLSPADIIEGLSIPSEKKQVLVEFAGMFEKKEVMPASSDVRNFLVRRGVAGSAGKNRPQSLRVILPVLAEMSDDSIRKLISKPGRSSVAELGPISDAIRDVSTARNMNSSNS
jgi:hypothetical protein